MIVQTIIHITLINYIKINLMGVVELEWHKSRSSLINQLI